ncbi:AI-2E family transporter [Devosia pacifica]|uniref:AI-2E family transporter n=1 Tax=Devosia pacifica TaxID=1335967 RepID=A0A918RV37_9HYPH|nr:AI-2E family transporter [Devosia pacifica]GHA11644.1 AI-2E family transporter [Devosia pacifica]
MTLRNHVLIWIGISIVFLGLLWLFRGILLPFVVGAALAYLLNPVVNFVQRAHIGRGWATAVVLLIVVTILGGLLLMLVPLAAQQAGGLVQRLPGYASNLQELARELAPQLTDWLGEDRAAQLETTIADLLGDLVGMLGSLTADILASGMTLISVFSFIVFTPVVAFYMLLDWQKMMHGAQSLMPRQNRDEIQRIMSDIDKSMAGVIRGQGSVIMILAAFYATSLTLTGLNFGLAIGLIAGLFSFVPFVGFAIGLVLSMAVAIVQFGENWVMIAVVFGIYMVGQFLEGNVLYPKLVGSSININPVWLMFALLASGLVFGFIGVLLAVPLAAIVGVLVRYAIAKYRASSLYLGTSDETGDDASIS